MEMKAILRDLKTISMNQDHDLKENGACVNQTMDCLPLIAAKNISSSNTQDQSGIESSGVTDTQDRIQKVYDTLASLKAPALTPDFGTIQSQNFFPNVPPNEEELTTALYLTLLIF